MVGVSEKVSKVMKAFGGVVEFYDEYMRETGHVQAQRKIVERLKDYLEGGGVLDVATGTGVMIERIDRSVGIDVSREMVKEAKRKHNGKDFLVGDVGCLPFKDKAFDVAMSCLAYLWFPDRKQALEEMKRVSRKRVLVIEEEGVPARRRINIPEHLKAFFEEIERLEAPISIEELDSKYARVAEADIDGSHKFVAWNVPA